MMEYIQEKRVFYGDTDAYGVVWHGAYTRWLEEARTEAFEKSLKMSLPELEAGNIQFPVAEMNIRYKSPARIHENIVIKTHISDLKPFCVTFETNIYNKETQALRITAHVTIAVTNAETGRMFRRMPENLYERFKQAAGELISAR